MLHPTKLATTPCRAPRLEIRPGVWIDSRLALWLQPTRTLVVADIHWGYAESHRVHGNLLPAWGDAEIAARLRALLADYQPTEMIWLGDSLHTVAGRTAAEAFLSSLDVPVTILAGNHDLHWARVADTPTLIRGEFFLHHGDRPALRPSALIEVVGHHHPAFVWHDGAGARLKLPALVAAPRRLVLPAFSPWAAGAPWRAADDEIIYAIGTKRIFTVSGGSPQKEPFV